jgi:hypothetical protein
MKIQKTKSEILKEVAYRKARKEGRIIIENYNELSQKQKNTIMNNIDLFFILIDIKLVEHKLKGIPKFN